MEPVATAKRGTPVREEVHMAYLINQTLRGGQVRGHVRTAPYYPRNSLPTNKLTTPNHCQILLPFLCLITPKNTTK